MGTWSWAPVPCRMSGHVSLAYKGLTELPRDCIAKLEDVGHLDLSHNDFSYPEQSVSWPETTLWSLCWCPHTARFTHFVPSLSLGIPRRHLQTICSKIASLWHAQEVVTYMSRVEAGSKLNQSWSRDRGNLQTAKHGCNLIFDPLKIKQSRA